MEDTYQGIKHIDMVPNLSAQNPASIDIGKDFMLSHGYIKNDFDVGKWAAPEFLEQAAKELLNERWAKVTADKLPAAMAVGQARPAGGRSPRLSLLRCATRITPRSAGRRGWALPGHGKSLQTQPLRLALKRTSAPASSISPASSIGWQQTWQSSM